MSKPKTCEGCKQGMPTRREGKKFIHDGGQRFAVECKHGHPKKYVFCEACGAHEHEDAIGKHVPAWWLNPKCGRWLNANAGKPCVRSHKEAEKLLRPMARLAGSGNLTDGVKVHIGARPEDPA